jgi:hydrophobic/amphiphilic exporter-1 (mainly G- bacteria), HAE1 family
MTRAGVPIYLRDIAEVKDTTEDLRSFTRINGNPGVRLRITKQSGTNTVAVAESVRTEVERINREVGASASRCSTTARSSSSGPSRPCARPP